MNNFSYVLKRILQMIPVFIIVTVLVFLMIRLIPGNPARTILGEKAPLEKIMAKEIEMGLDKPLFVQFWIYLKDLAHLNFGDSIHYSQPVLELIKARLPVTLLLTLTSMIFTILISIPAGYLAGMKKDRMADQVVRGFSLFGLSAPSFWIGMLLLMVFSVWLKWLPINGWGAAWGERLKSMILPGLTSAIGVSAMIVRNLRNNIVDIKQMDYVSFAKSKGLSRLRISVRHIIRNALIPTTTLLALKFLSVLGGSVVTETVFNLPGIGSLLVNSILARDYAVVQCLVMIFVVVVLIANLLTDILYSILDPRVKLQ